MNREFSKSNRAARYDVYTSSCIYIILCSIDIFLKTTRVPCLVHQRCAHFPPTMMTIMTWRRRLLFSISLFRSSTCFLQGKRTLAFMSPLRNYSSSDETIVLPEREYGYASKPFTWPDLVEIIKEKPNLAKLSRSVEQQTEYIRYTRNMLKEWKTVYDHVLVSKFELSKRRVPNPNHDGRNATLWEAYPPLSELTQVKKVLCRNDFPYYMDDGIEHWCLWKLCQDIQDQEVEEAKEELRQLFGPDAEFLCWRNPPHLKSLPDIDHYHILVRKGEEPN